jgi:hypothetical protein
MRLSRRLFVVWACLGCSHARTLTEPSIAVQGAPVPLDASDPAVREVGELAYRGGLALAARDPRWGGLSGLVVSDDGARLTAVSDRGTWFTARLGYDERGWLSGVSDVAAGALADPDSRPLEGKKTQDAEALTSLDDGTLIVSFERQHRLWRFGAGPRPFAVPPLVQTPPAGLESAPSNGGIETLVALDGGRLLALTEDLVEDGLVRGWLFANGRWDPLGYRVHGSLRPSDGARLPSGDVLILERNYDAATGVVVRLSCVAASDLAPAAALEGRALAEVRRPLTVDNFEGIAARRGPAGETLVYLLSDDNFSAEQRTLLLMFALAR